MIYYYDTYGWHSEEAIAGRETTKVPPHDLPPGHAANFTGHEWVVIEYVAPPAPEQPLTPQEADAKLYLVERQMLGAIADVLLGGDTSKLQLLQDEANRLRPVAEGS